MNTTNRGFNRLLLLIVGLLLIAAGAAAALLVALPAFATGWTAWFNAVPTAVPWAVTEVAGQVGWLAIAVAVAALILALLLIAFIVRQGHGHTAEVLERRTGEHGRTRIDLAIPRTLLTNHLDDLPDLLASRVTAYEVRGTPTLKISVRARRGASPATVTQQVTDALHALDTVLGQQLPAYVQISGGFRARTATRARVA